VLAVHHSEQAILSERVAGETWFSRLTDESARLSVASDFMRILAQWHQLDPARLSLDGEDIPGDLAEAATREIDKWEALYRFGDLEPDPMIEFGLAWLRRNIPPAVGPVVIVQGDTGPGNFLYADGRVTAVLDWELAHWGDPMEDLGWLALRAVQEPFTVFADRLRDYSRHTGWELDLDRIRYYRAFAELRVVILGHRRNDVADQRGEVGNGLIYGELHRRLFCEAMADNLGLAMPERPELTAPSTDVEWLYDAMLTQIREIVVPRSTDPFVVQRSKGMARVLKYLQQVDRYGEAAGADELADLRALLGEDVASIADGRASLVKRLAAGEVSDADALRYFGRRTLRNTELLRPAMGVLADRHFDPLT
jgi:hypothetical protein